MKKGKLLIISFLISCLCLLVSCICFAYQGFNTLIGELLSYPAIIFFGIGYGGGESAAILAGLVILLLFWILFYFGLFLNNRKNELKIRLYSEIYLQAAKWSFFDTLR